VSSREIIVSWNAEPRADAAGAYKGGSNPHDRFALWHASSQQILAPLWIATRMNPQHHPDDATLVAYAAGAASEATALVVASHLAFCERCRLETARVETIGGALLGDLAADTVNAESLARILARLGETPPVPVTRESIAANSWMPTPLQHYLRADWREERWRWFSPGIKHLPLVSMDDEGRGHVRLVWAAPGRSLPSHGHDGSELTLVLSGHYSDKTGRFSPGDVSELDDTIIHRPVAGADEDCLCLLACDGAFKPVSPLARGLMRWLKL
jgi:putative transcriptional regulator